MSENPFKKRERIVNIGELLAALNGEVETSIPCELIAYTKAKVLKIPVGLQEDTSLVIPETKKIPEPQPFIRNNVSLNLPTIAQSEEEEE